MRPIKRQALRVSPQTSKGKAKPVAAQLLNGFSRKKHASRKEMCSFSR